MMAAATPALEGAVRVHARQETRNWFASCVEQHMDALYGVALRLAGSRADAEDLVADSIAAAWASIESLQDRGRLRPWLFRIMHNRCISDHRKRAVRPVEQPYSDLIAGDDGDEVSSLLLEQPLEFLQWWANPESELVNRMLGEQIRAAIDSLPEVFRIVVLLVNVEGLAYDEAAEVLGVPTGTIRSRMKRGRTLLQKALWEQAKEAGLTVSPKPDR
jgi:RNA polymerase sigma-70 factor (ECF subfamily)